MNGVIEFTFKQPGGDVRGVVGFCSCIFCIVHFLWVSVLVHLHALLSSNSALYEIVLCIGFYDE